MCLLEFRVSLYNFALASGLTGVIQEVAVWLTAACPHFEKFEAPEAWAPFSPTAAPELCLTLHKMKAMCHKLVPTGRCHGFHIGRSSWRKEGPGGVVGVSHDHTEKCLMSCDVFGRAINTHTDVMAVKVEQSGD